MEKIILRKDVLLKHKSITDLSFLYLANGKEKYKSKEQLINKFGFKELMKRLFNEDIDNENLLESNLYQFYFEILTKDKEKNRCHKENDKFIELYKINDEFALQLDFNIHLYHLVPKKESHMKIVPWYYTDSKIYIGDTWGEQDDEIIESIQNLSFLDFLKRYKGY